MAGDGRTLWIAGDRSRFFLVPDDAALPDGEFAVRDLLGRPRKVGEAALVAYEVSRVEADARIRAGLSEAIDSARHAFSDLLPMGAVAPPLKLVTPDCQIAGKPPDPASEKLRRDVAALKMGLQDLLGGFADAVKQQREGT